MQLGHLPRGKDNGDTVKVCAVTKGERTSPPDLPSAPGKGASQGILWGNYTSLMASHFFLTHSTTQPCQYSQ